MQGLFETFCHHFGDVEPVTTSDLIGPTRKAMLCFLAGEIAPFHKPQASGFLPVNRKRFSRWLEAEHGAVAPASFLKYKGVLSALLRFLDMRAHLALEAITTDDFLAYRNHLLAQGRAPRTVNNTIRKILSRPFQAAVNQGYIPRNPIAAVRHLHDVTIQKGTFTPQQISALLEVASSEWKGLQSILRVSMWKTMNVTVCASCIRAAIIHAGNGAIAKSAEV
jgi:hypothetical protein